MMKLINLITATLLVLAAGSCSWATQGLTKEFSVSGKRVCELSLGGSEKLLQGSYDKIPVYTEEGESYKFRGKICDNSVLAEIEINSHSISKISIIDVDFCVNGICIGKPFEEIQKLIPNSKLFFSGEEGGFFSLEATNGIRYEFSTEGITIDCYVNRESCRDKIERAKLKAIVI
ncbi:hypothetical protein QT397_15100 [Microbulbifer sp. MKSA007]|nr:hypothetical protein QT397_15100 [Microbulbifer sp. MKSA007]